jgi:hypothetical protein
MSMADRRRWLMAGLALVAGVSAVLAGCALSPPGPRVVSVSEARLVERLARQFPYNHRYMELFEVRFSEPRVRLMPEDNRVATRLDVAVGLLDAGQRQRQGTVTLSYGFRLAMDDRTLRLHELRVDALDVPGLPAPVAALLQRLTGALVQDQFRDLVIHRLDDDDLRRVHGWIYEPADLRVVPGGLELELRPVRRD